MSENSIIYDRTVQLYKEMENYIKAVEKKTQGHDLSKLKKEMGTMEPDKLKDRAFDILATKQLHNMDIGTIQSKFIHFYEAHILLSPDIKFEPEITATYGEIKRNQVKPFYTLDKDDELTEVEKGVSDKIRENFKTYNMEMITQELEKELKNIK